MLLHCFNECAIKKEIALEVNTSGYKTFLHNPNPSPAIIKRYRELGGKLITIGSDAHSPEYIGFHFEDVKKLLNSLGIHEYAIFENIKVIDFQNQWKTVCWFRELYKSLLKITTRESIPR